MNRLAAPFLLTASLAAATALPGPATAQVPTLGRVDSLVTAGEYEQARTILDRWWSAREEFEVPGSDMARALMLRARLAPDPGAAEPDYLAVVLGYPTSDHAPEALLRLGQGLLASGDATRAAAYLERLVVDYPGRAQRTTALLWLARANLAARRPEAACSAARTGLDDARDPELRTLLQVEAAASCTIGGEPVERVTTPRRTDTEAERRADTEAERRAAAEQAEGEPDAGEAAATEPAEPEPGPDTLDRAPTGRFAAQTGAFRYRESADRLVAQLQEAGYQPRLVLVPESRLLRVRIGRFASRDEAAQLVARLQDQGVDAVIVSDVRQEREP